MSNLGLERHLKKASAWRCTATKVGDRYVVERMREIRAATSAANSRAM
jgi:phosphomannomutase